MKLEFIKVIFKLGTSFCGSTNNGYTIILLKPSSYQVGTVGGGTILPAQSSCLEMLGVKGPHPTNPGQNASTLAR